MHLFTRQINVKSELRVRHREETKVVSRLTMENMNLASRCREAISQVAALKKELMVYQKRQNSLTGEYAGLQREVSLLKKQMSGGGKNGINGLQNPNAGATNVSTLSGGNGENVESKLQQRNAASPTTELDRIMSLQKFGGTQKQPPTDVPALADNNTNQDGNTGAKDNAGNKLINNQENAVVVSSNSKIPISIVTSSKASTSSTTTNQKDDEFDADIDMVDFFNKQSTSTSSTGSDLQRHHQSQINTKSLHHHVRKPKTNTDDRMPGDVVSPPPGSAFSPESNARKLTGDSLLSSLDAFEASFASAFPETSFSITSDAPKETKMDMTFDVPDFGDPFFQNFKTTPTPAMVFDSTPMSFDMSGPSIDSAKGKPVRGTNRSNHRSTLAPLSPQSMSAEIEQLDAIANLTGSNEKGDGSSDSSSSASKITRKIRNVKQPVSYAEPSTKAKLRRGDVLFPKVDAQQKYKQTNIIDKTAATTTGTTTSPQGNAAKVLKDLEQVSAIIDLGKDP
ncbi:hypothetical protein ACHAWX_001929 [Stephanocyclus meneghinianus]